MLEHGWEGQLQGRGANLMLVWAAKDPDEVATRFIDWTKHPSWIECDTISSSSASLSTAAGMTIDATDDDANTISQVTLSGGTAESVGKVCARSSRTKDRRFSKQRRSW
jgi:hypothetical protein